MEKEAGKHAGMDAEIRQERGIYAVYAGGKHYASCDSYREAHEELAEIRKAPHEGTAIPGAHNKKANYSIQDCREKCNRQGGKNGKAL